MEFGKRDESTRFITTVPTAIMPLVLERLDSKYIARIRHSRSVLENRVMAAACGSAYADRLVAVGERGGTRLAMLNEVPPKLTGLHAPISNAQKTLASPINLDVLNAKNSPAREGAFRS